MIRHEPTYVMHRAQTRNCLVPYGTEGTELHVSHLGHVVDSFASDSLTVSKILAGP